MKPSKAPTDPVSRVLLNIASLALCVMMMVVVGDVALRAVFNTPIKGAYDIVSIALLVTIMFGLGPVVAQKGEILIDLIDAVLPTAGLRMLALISATTGVGLFLFFGWAMINPALDAWRWGERSLELNLPKWPLWGITFVGMLAIFWAYLLQFRAALHDSPTKEDQS